MIMCQSFGILTLILLSSVIDCFKLNLWPWPQKITYNKTEYVEISSQKIQVLDYSWDECDVIDAAINRYRERLFVQDCSKLDPFNGKHVIKYVQQYYPQRSNNKTLKPQITKIIIKNNGVCEKYPHSNMNENYTLNITEDNVWLDAHSAWGILRGLQTLSQLIESIGKQLFRLPILSIEDGPNFPHRGLLIDSSRHFLTLKSIYDTVDSLELNKMNVLHWHIVDDQSFPYVSKKFPDLSLKGAYDSETHVYTRQQVADLIEYARLRGIRVLPEFDTPGHAASWGKSLKQLLTQCYDFISGKPNGKYGPMNPAKEFTYKFLYEFFSEVSDTFPDDYVHIGGDEVPFDCWFSNPEIYKFITKNNMKRVADLEVYFVDRLVRMMHGFKRKSIVWQETVMNGIKLPNDTVVQVWQSWSNNLWQDMMRRLMIMGQPSLLSAPWYLDSISTEREWARYYDVDLFGFDKQFLDGKRLLLGGEACLWGEWVDSSNLISRSWPRASAVAERLWSVRNFSDFSQAERRIATQQCYMQRMGIHVAPIDGPGFCPCDYVL